MKPQLDGVRYTLGGSLTPAVRILLWINGLTFLFLFMVGSRIFEPAGRPYADLLVSLLGVNPTSVLHDWALWQPITYLFVHKDFWHLLFNMLGLWWFGAELESGWGSKKFMRFYLFTGVGAGVVSALLGIPTIGASGALYGLLLAYGLLFPNRVLYLYFVIPVKAKYCVLVFGGIEFFSMVFAGGGGVNHAAHLSGLGFGILWFVFERRPFHLVALLRTYRRYQLRKRFRLIRRAEEKKDTQGPYDNSTIH